MQNKSTAKNKAGLSSWLAWAIIAALAFLVMKFEFPLIPMIPYLKMDFSDVIIVLSTFIFGPLGGTMVALFKCLLSYLISGANILSLVGDLAAFFASMSFALPIYYISKRDEKSNGRKIWGIVVGIICLTIVMSVLNAFVLTPMYIKFSGFKLQAGMLNYIFTAIVPFNLAKGLVNGILVFILMKTVMPQLEKYAARRFN
jgi:riboflavin transporter FmnP